MDPLWFNPPLWCNALTLAERGATLSGDQSSWQLGDSSAERGQRRFERWRSQPPFTTDPYFAQRLAKDGIDQARLLYLLGEPLESLCARLSQPPSWLTELAEAFADSASPFDNPPYDDPAFVDPESDELESDEEEFSFLDLIQPFIDNACDRLQAGVDVLINRADNPDSLPFDPETIEEILLMNLTDPLLMRLSRTLVLELNVARLQGYLQGNTPKERYQSFIERIREPQEASAILAEYPVLARQLTLCINQWLNVSLEFLDRLCCDWELILCNFCSTENPGKIVDITGGAGDTHRGGRSVMIATFDSGFRIVYKPKSLAIDTHFQELLAWLNHNGNEPQFRTLTVVDRGEYGWVEYVNQQGCSSVNELKRFYRRHGAYLALLYTLNANDFHFENLIAVGEHPVLIDLETLFQPQFDSFDEAEADRAVDKVMAESVLQVGLLPLRLWSSAEYAGIDVSGFGGMAGQLSPERVPQLNGVGTDEMHFVRQRIELAGDANRPSLNDVEVSSAEYVEDVVLGFTTMYQLLTKLRVKLLADNGPLACFAHDEIRILLRPTRTYDQLLFESFHPDLLRDSLERERFLDRLWIAVLERPYLDKVIAAEQADLLQGDIPIFMAHPSSLELWGASGERIRGVLSEAGMDSVHRRIGQLNDEEMHRQVWFIRASLASLDADGDSPFVPTYRLVEAQTSASQARLFAGVQAVADHLVATAIYGKDDVAWVGMDLVRERNWEIVPLGDDLYGGISGIALFLAYAGANLHNEEYTALAQRAAYTMVRHIVMFGAEMGGTGGFKGWGGTLYALTHLALLWDDPRLLSQAHDMVDVLAGLVVEENKFDLTEGAAGAIVTLLAFHHCVPSSKTLGVAIAFGEQLVASAQSTTHGVSWANPSLDEKPPKLPIGLGHGNAGIALALLKLAAVTGNEHYRVIAQQAIDHERTLFVPQAETWDERSHAAQFSDAQFSAEERTLSSVPQISWFQGVAGIGLARLYALEHLNDPKLYAEIEMALQMTLTHGFGQSHSLSYGDMGNLEFLLQASQLLNNSPFHMERERMAAMLLDSIERDGWQCAGPKGVEMPGLMLGLAGIGYEMLRLALPDLVPSVLVLAPPISRPN